MIAGIEDRRTELGVSGSQAKTPELTAKQSDVAVEEGGIMKDNLTK